MFCKRNSILSLSITANNETSKFTCRNTAMCDGFDNSELIRTVYIYLISNGEHDKILHNQLTTVSLQIIFFTCKIWDFHGGDYEECRFLGCGAV
jgi:hypothetical protein